MKFTGAEILETLVLASVAAKGGTLTIEQIGRALNDGERLHHAKFRHELMMLVEVGLVEQRPVMIGRKLHFVYRPTERGDQVDAEIARITHARGGEFRPRQELVREGKLSHRENTVLS